MIAISRLTLELGTRRVLDDVSFSVRRGESVGLVGPNGSGKTSLIRCLLGLVPFTGHAAIGGHDVVRAPVLARSLVAYLPQRPGFGDATGEEALRFVARLRRIDRSRVAEAAAEVGLVPHLGERARTYSGGMQQRLSLALAWLTDAPVLLLDEPTASLDCDGQERFFDIAGRMRRRGRTLLLASHRADEIERLTDRVIALDRGRMAGALGGESRLARVLPLCADGKGEGR